MKSGNPLVVATSLVSILLVVGTSSAAELTPLMVERPLGEAGPEIGHYSERTVVAAIEIDRDEARLLGFTYKSRPFVRDTRKADIRDYDDEHRSLQLEVALVGPAGDRYTQRTDAGPLCLFHDASAEPHVAGDTILLHRDSILVELPEVTGFDRVEVAYHDRERGSRMRRSLGSPRLEPARFDPAGRPIAYADLLFADPTGTSVPLVPTAADIEWPEDHGDPDIYQIFGDPSGGQERINVVIVPDGYTYAEKALMETHAAQMVQYFRSKTPYAQHDPFLNYTLVYAYSLESGTDQCDCDIVVDTAMGTRFLESNPICGHSDNRCLFYGSGCDTAGMGNIAAAELRAPYRDESVVMVNTTRYGGCGGIRAVYAAGNSQALELAVHETAHSLGGLADEYAYDNACGSNASEINTSKDAVDGAWPEWVSTIGPPYEGAQYYQQCLYRPAFNCEMRALNQSFCVVCNQHWSLVTFGHPRVSPTAPIRSQDPGPSIVTLTDVPVDFTVLTRLSQGAVSNDFSWSLTVPGSPTPFNLLEDDADHTRSFSPAGSYLLEVTVTADTNFVKPERYGSNQESVAWSIDAFDLPEEISPPGAATPLRFSDPDTLVWEDGSGKGASTYNLYRGSISGLASGNYGDCLAEDLVLPTASGGGDPPAGSGHAYLVTGENPAAEGPLGNASGGDPRTPAAACD